MGVNYTKCLLPISPNKVDIQSLASRADTVTNKKELRVETRELPAITNQDGKAEFTNKADDEKLMPLLGLQVFIPSKGYGQMVAFVGKNYGRTLFIVQVSFLTPQNFDCKYNSVDVRWQEIGGPNKN